MARFFAVLARHRRRSLALVALCAALLAGKAWHDTMRDPVVLHASVTLQGMVPDSSPVTAALISDIHVAGPDMSPARLEKIVAQINALGPDVVLIAGDLVSEKNIATHVYSPEEIVAPLGQLSARLGVVVVPGNHDHWFNWRGLQAQLAANDITALQNEAAQIGPLAIGGLDDAYTGRDDMPSVLKAMEGIPGGRLLLSHSPDIFPRVPPEITLVLAGHTHCGQISLPIIGAPAYMSRYGDRFACGKVIEGVQTIIISAGLGTSLLPLRFGTRPEIWLVELSPQS